MGIRIGINGFGRMGRLGVRAVWSMDAFEIAHINEIAIDACGSAHLLTFDSIHGIWDKFCHGEDESISIEGQSITYSMHQNISETDWSGCDIVIEATGKFRKPEQLQAFFDQGVKKVIVAAPVEGVLNIVYGVNDDWYNPAEHHLLTAASCTTNCLAPIVKVMH